MYKRGIVTVNTDESVGRRNLTDT